MSNAVHSLFAVIRLALTVDLRNSPGPSLRRSFRYALASSRLQASSAVGFAEVLERQPTADALTAVDVDSRSSRGCKGGP